MATFKNLVTGNILTTNEPEAIRLMEDSDRYAEVPAAEKAPVAKQTSTKSGK